MKPQLTLIAAMDENRLLANEHGIPWHLPRDVAHFREYTKDKWLLLGRRTFEEMRGWFRTGHVPLVLTRQKHDRGKGILPLSEQGQDALATNPLRTVATIEEALTLAAQAGQTALVCCGGAQVFSAALPHADRLVLTLVQAAFPPGKNPVYFPQWSPFEWTIISESYYPSDADNACAMRLITLARTKIC
ncbi:MAG: dihydrofolate reductase [Verrucomicrobiaceae bacterium]